MNLRKPIVAGVAVAALMLSPLSAFAQDTTTTTETTTETTETPATETPATDAPATDAPAADAGTAGVAAAVEGLPSQNWLKVCDPLENGQKACIMRQVVLANGQFLGSFLLRDDPGQESRLLAVAAVPLGVLLPFGLTWQIDNSKPVRVPYMLCDTQSCSTQLVINEQYVNSLKRGAKLTLTAKNRQNEDLAIEINLAGFTATYDGEAALTFEQLQQETSGQNALEQVLQDRAEQLRQELTTQPGTDAPATPETPATEEAPAQ
ncbi:MAG: invasion associated locus B family protein [Devosia sp.]|uniref:invasion associated locus B family protein n=1 Tax=Devosia sp. TaxID=1871048 RepID=UPI0024CDD384|nr:invasion associated locus B family protein [Devosia sp.]UYO00120.1 MAG: invasion associated locus B family protein [Devosia sp.]